MSAAAVSPLRTWQVVQMRRAAWRWEGQEQAANPELCFHRHKTVQLLERYFRLSMEVGRVPSALGGETFRARFKSRRKYTFEDGVIFVHDVESCLKELDWFSQQLIVWSVLQGYTQEETARALGCGRRTVSRRLPEALDRMSEIFLRKEMLW